MRLTEKEKDEIKCVFRNLDNESKVYLFGSRIDDLKKGGDIDLLIISNLVLKKDSSRIKEELYSKLGEQKIDLIIVRDESDPFTKIALKEGILL